jgi:hypothetical protein
VFDWLFEGRPAVYVTLGVLAVLFAALWWRDRRRAWLYALGVVALLAVVYLVLDRLVETRGEQITRRLQTIEKAVKAGNPELVMRQFSPQFTYRGVTRDRFHNMVIDRLKSKFVDDMTIWEVRIPDASGKVFFKAKPKGATLGDYPGFQVRADFVQDADGQWRMMGFEVYNLFVDAETPIDITPYIR